MSHCSVQIFNWWYVWVTLFRKWGWNCSNGSQQTLREHDKRIFVISIRRYGKHMVKSVTMYSKQLIFIRKLSWPPKSCDLTLCDFLPLRVYNLVVAKHANTMCYWQNWTVVIQEVTTNFEIFAEYVRKNMGDICLILFHI